MYCTCLGNVGYRSVVSLDLVCARTCRLLFSAARVHQRSMSHVERGSKVRSGQVGKVGISVVQGSFSSISLGTVDDMQLVPT